MYKSECHVKEEEMNNNFKDIPLPTLNTEERDKLETCVLETEVQSTIKVLSFGKTPHKDGYNMEYKVFRTH